MSGAVDVHADGGEPLHFSAPGAGAQQLPVYGYRLARSRHALLQVVDAAGARLFLRSLLQRGWLATAAISSPPQRVPLVHSVPIDLGFSWRGLRALGLAPALAEALRRHARAFVEGAVPRAAQHLGDSGDNAPDWWDCGFGVDEAHLALSLHADTAAALQARWQALQQLPGAGALAGWAQVHDAAHLTTTPTRREVHFGWRDGIANPRIRGLHAAADAQGAGHAAGELLLGYDNDDGYNPFRLATEPAAAAFFRNASFGVLRKLAQHEGVFRAWLARSAAQQGATVEWLMAKLCGRWPDGRQVLPADAPTQTQGQALQVVPQADFSADRQGQGCPFGAHIRRLNPHTDPLVQRRPRPLMRRGMPYGPRWTGPDDKAERGLLGLFFCASLEDQFEHLLGRWADRNPLGPPNLGTAKDPLIGQHEDPQAWLHVPMAGGAPARALGGFTPFVSTRGTCYLLYPALPAIATLAADPPA